MAQITGIKNQAEIAKDTFIYHTKLAAIKALDYESEAEDDHIWIPDIILDHKVKHQEVTDGKKKYFIKLKLQWRDGEKSWISLDDVKMTEPVMCLKYAVKHKLLGKTGWEWVEDFLTTDDRFAAVNRMILAAKTAPKYKFGVKVPRSPKHALELDKKEAKKLWEQSIITELTQILDYETFRVIPDGEPTPLGYRRIPYHIIFDVKVDGRHKARLVAGGHKTDPPKEDVYSGVVSLEAIRMGFLLAKMNNLMVCAGDIGNAFLYGKTREKVFVIAGPEFGP